MDTWTYLGANSALNVLKQIKCNDRDHVHMNSTQWETLTEFIKWLGREGTVTYPQFIVSLTENLRKFII